jgi:hypothetical protein
MIFTGFKRKSNQIFFNKQFDNFLEESLKNTSNNVRKVLIFIDDTSKVNEIKSSLISLFDISEEALEILVFQKKLSKKNNNDNVYSPKDFGWYGKIKSEKLKDILTKKYDLLINYSKIENIYCNLLILRCKTSLRVGFSHLKSKFYDLTIQCEPTEIRLFNEELKKYLVILKKA